MAEFKSPVTNIERPAEAIYYFLADFNNFKNLIPEDRVSGYESTKDTCSFTVENMPAFHLMMGNNIPVQQVEMIPQNASGVTFSLLITIQQISQSGSQVSIRLNAELNAFLKMMASKPLQTFVDTLAEKLKEFMEQ